MDYLKNYSVVDDEMVSPDGEIVYAATLIARVCTAKDTGEKFLGFKIAQRDGKLIDARFRRDCDNAPDFPMADGKYVIVLGDVIPPVDKNRIWPRCYIKHVDGVLPAITGFSANIDLV